MPWDAWALGQGTPAAKKPEGRIKYLFEGEFLPMLRKVRYPLSGTGLGLPAYRHAAQGGAGTRLNLSLARGCVCGHVWGWVGGGGSYHVMTQHVTSYHMISYHIVYIIHYMCFIMYYIRLHHIASHHITLYCIVLHYFMLYHIILCYIMHIIIKTFKNIKGVP